MSLLWHCMTTKVWPKGRKKRRLFVLHFVFCHFFITVFLISRRFLSRESSLLKLTLLTNTCKAVIIVSIYRFCLAGLLFKHFWSLIAMTQAGLRKSVIPAEKNVMTFKDGKNQSWLFYYRSNKISQSRKMSSKQIKVSGRGRRPTFAAAMASINYLRKRWLNPTLFLLLP